MKVEYYAVLDLAPLQIKQLDELGSQGWELVSSTFAPQRGWYYVFQRPTGASPIAPVAVAQCPCMSALKWLRDRLRSLWKVLCP
jgi:hypothetical protein